MWVKSYSKTYQGVSKEAIWAVWSDLSVRHLWDIDTEWVKFEGSFVQGAIFYMKPKDGPKIKMHISEVIPNEKFTDCFKFPLAKLYGIHTMEQTTGGLQIITSIKVVGMLGWLLRKIVAEKIVLELPGQTDALVALARKHHE